MQLAGLGTPAIFVAFFSGAPEKLVKCLDINHTGVINAPD